jgi:hypothetical protein
MPDEEANIFKVRNLYGRHGRICGGHKREGECALPGEVSVRVSHYGEYQGLQERRRFWKGMEKSAEGIVGLSTGLKART